MLSIIRTAPNPPATPNDKYLIVTYPPNPTAVATIPLTRMNIHKLTLICSPINEMAITLFKVFAILYGR